MQSVRRFGLAISAVVAVSPSIVSASDWWMLSPPKGERPNRAIFYADKSSLIDVDGYRRVWLSVVVEGPGATLVETRTYAQFDCAGARYKLLQETRLNADGKTQSASPSSDWQYLIPDTPMPMAAKNICSGAFYDGIKLEDATPRSWAAAMLKPN